MNAYMFTYGDNQPFDNVYFLHQHGSSSVTVEIWLRKIEKWLSDERFNVMEKIYCLI